MSLIKTTGAKFRAFWIDPEFWPDTPVSSKEPHTWVEDEVIVINGTQWDFDGDVELQDFIKDDDIVKFGEGCVFNPRGMKSEECSFSSYFKAWEKKQTVDIITVQLPKGGAALLRLKEFLDHHGGKLLK